MDLVQEINPVYTIKYLRLLILQDEKGIFVPFLFLVRYDRYTAYISYKVIICKLELQAYIPK